VGDLERIENRFYNMKLGWHYHKEEGWCCNNGLEWRETNESVGVRLYVLTMMQYCFEDDDTSCML
jgi:hypothetical protein